MHNKFAKAIVAKLVFSLMLSSTSLAFAAESSPVQKAFEGVKDQLDTLVTAKDEKSLNDVGLRIETFKKILDFSEQEAKDLKIKLLDYDEEKSPSFIYWRESAITRLNAAISHYEAQRDIISANKITNLEGIKDLASQFKDWREGEYIPVANEINDFLIVMQEQKSILVAKKRLQKIREDLATLQKSKIKGITPLNALIKKASDFIDEGTKINNVAHDLFWSTYIFANSSSTENASSTQSSSTLAIQQPLKKDTASSSESSASSTVSASSTIVEAAQPLSIKDLVRDSLSKLKDAYRIFIEMSNLVRKLLG
ncbi:MAG: hypothetical protein AAB617_00470 [Patescibacteria group bacterium]